MVIRRVALLLLLYVTLDFTNPHMPGAMTFDAEDSVEGVRAERGRPSPSAAVALPAPRPAAPVPDARPRFAGRRPVDPRQPPRWRARHVRRTPPPASSVHPSEDH